MPVTPHAPAALPKHPPAIAPARKWTLLGMFWVLQAVIVYLASAFWITLNFNSGGSNGPLYSFDIGDFFSLLIEPEWVLPMLAGILLFSTLQGLLLLPVERPCARLEGRGAPLWLSAGSAAVAVALLWGAAIAAVLGGLELLEVTSWTISFETPFLWIVISLVVLCWLVATPLMFVFISRGRRETRLARLSATLFLGTVVEAIAILPLDVMTRRRTDCFCDTGTFWALTACGTVGMFVLGPAIFLPLVAKRRRRWYQGKCDACGYDMSGTPSAQRCPECGAGWRGGE